MKARIFWKGWGRPQKEVMLTFHSVLRVLVAFSYSFCDDEVFQFLNISGVHLPVSIKAVWMLVVIQAGCFFMKTLLYSSFLMTLTLLQSMSSGLCFKKTVESLLPLTARTWIISPKSFRLSNPLRYSIKLTLLIDLVLDALNAR